MRYYYVTRTGLFLDKFGRFVEDMRKAWVTTDRLEAIKMCEEHMAFVGVLV